MEYLPLLSIISYFVINIKKLSHRLLKLTRKTYHFFDKKYFLSIWFFSCIFAIDNNTFPIRVFTHFVTMYTDIMVSGFNSFYAKPLKSPFQSQPEISTLFIINIIIKLLINL